MMFIGGGDRYQIGCNGRTSRRGTHPTSDTSDIRVSEPTLRCGGATFFFDGCSTTNNECAVSRRQGTNNGVCRQSRPGQEGAHGNMCMGTDDTLCNPHNKRNAYTTNNNNNNIGPCRITHNTANQARKHAHVCKPAQTATATHATSCAHAAAHAPRMRVLRTTHNTRALHIIVRFAPV